MVKLVESISEKPLTDSERANIIRGAEEHELVYHFNLGSFWTRRHNDKCVCRNTPNSP
jgi:hypothetical protein